MEVAQAKVLKATEVAFAKCDCCALTEECTEEYIKRVRDRYSGRWICGLCAEAVKDEVLRSAEKIGNEEALNQHMTFCKKFRSLSPPINPTEDLISAVKQLLFKTLDSPRSSPVKKPGFRSLDSPRSSPVKKPGFRSLDSPLSSPGFRGLGSPQSSPGKNPGLIRCENCFPGRILNKLNEN